MRVGFLYFGKEAEVGRAIADADRVPECTPLLAPTLLAEPGWAREEYAEAEKPATFTVEAKAPQPEP